jgi:tripartite-type tricarboxylate transporter receptor subunit TctC
MRVLLAALAFFVALPAAAQDWPTRPIRLISPFAPGGSNDVTARLMAPRMQARLGQPVVVETRSGAGGMTGVDIAAKAPPDGHTLVLGTTGAVITAPLLSANRPFDATRDLAAITQAINVQVPVVVPARSPYRSLPELLAAARANPGKLTFGSSGTGGLPHLSGELIRITAKVEMVHVPYRGGAPAAMAIAAAEVDLALSDLPVFMPLVKDGQARILAVGAPQRLPFLPEVPTLGELGMPGIDTNNPASIPTTGTGC